MENPKRSMTREELYQLVWSTPMQKLATIYGLSDKGLAKTCHRHLVPIPPRGYWAKIDAGQAVKQTPLRKVDNTALHTVHIGSRKFHAASPYLLEVLAKAKKEIEAENMRLSSSFGDEQPIPAPPPPQKHTDSTTDDRDRPAKQQAEKFKSDIQSFISELRRCEADRDGFVKLKWVKVAPKDAHRVGTLLNSLAIELEPYGFSFNGNDSRIGFSKDGTTVDFQIEAPRKRKTDHSEYGWKLFTYVHEGRFKLQIFGHAEGIKKEWIDTDVKSVEDHLDKIVESFRINHVAEREHEERNRQIAERRAKMAARRKMLEQRIKREEDRLTYLRWIADARREADNLRTTIALASPDEEVTGEYRRMIEWATLRLRHLEEQSSIAAIQATLAEKGLFAFPDPLHDPEGDPPPKQSSWDA
ncbi:hypothetical protein [Agrobacterium tumefaciens]|uniref:hypothetical protein n=1 Tax=Agrobacterium tumefaciens TaxID=358 RepID=UPI003BA3193A